ncbi:MAG TPA: LamG-like jellyroll fold domain-containing protein [Sedimentisphaerales bacterium]|nr:LamG-like jellyroll fold domain-containing protein [Sedimentisphaerales bacterium]
MCKRLPYWLCVPLVLIVAVAAQAAVFSDNFDTPHDFLANGVAGTSWDGFLGAGPGETASALNISSARPGQLFLESTGAYWHEPWTPMGPFLYKVVRGDFVATVKVTEYAGTAASPVYHNTIGLMARAFPEDAGTGEDWVSLDYFPIWNCGNFVRSANDNVRTENGHNGLAFNLRPWLQIERRGSAFHFRTSADGVTWTAMAQSPLTRADLADVPLQVGLFQGTYNTTSGFGAFDEFKVEGPLVVPGQKSYAPTPDDKAVEVPADVLLSWTPSEEAVSHNVYFGASADSLETVAAAQDANSFDVGRLAFGQTYSWRVDDVRADGSLGRGDLWSFTVEPYSYPIQNVAATASSQNNKDMGPEKTVDGSGLDADDLHGVDAKTMWLSLKTGPQPTWIQYEFDQVYKVDQMRVWNSNQAMEPILGLGVKDVTIEYSSDGVTWDAVGDFELAQATGEASPSETLDLGGVMAQYVKLTIASNWGGILKQYGLGEVRFFYVPVTAREPKPASGATGVYPQVTLNWRAGRQAASHEVLLSTDEQAVLDGTAPAATVAKPQYETSVHLGQSYFWKVVEVNNAETPSAWESDVWTFTTADFLVVEDFESYKDDMEAGQAIFQTWIDGFDTPSTNGSIVGYSQAPFAERTIVNGGAQSMPLAYDNSKGAVYSEAKRTFESAQDWSKHGVKTLVVHFRGDATNTATTLYVKINDTKVLYNAGAPATALPVWKPWNIDLASTGANLKSVKSLTIGVGNGASGGTGTIYVDDIRLYSVAPQVVVPTDPGAAGIVANYAMEGDLQDSSGRNNHGTPMATVTYTNSLPGHGQALVLNGTNGYVELPIGSVISTLSDMTISTYVNFSGVGGGWQRVFDFGSNTTSYMFFCPSGGGGVTSPMRFAITTTGGNNESRLNGSTPLQTGWCHVAVVIDSATMTMRLQVDGVVVASGATAVLPKDLGVTTQNWLGRSQYEADAYFGGMVDNFRIYNRALSVSEVRYLAGDR